MTRLVRRSLTALAALLMVSGCNQRTVDGDNNDSHPLVFVASSSDRFATLQRSYQPILAMLSQETKREIIFKSFDDASIIEELGAGKIDILAVEAFSYVIAKKQGAQITAVAAGVDEKDGTSGYQSYGITPVGSPIQTLKDLPGKKVCFVDPESTSGYLYPIAELRALGIDPDRDITPIFKYRHDAVVLAVANGQCEAGFAGDWMVDRMVDRQMIEIEQGRLRAIITVWKSGTIPGPLIAISDRLPPDLRQQLITALQKNANADDLRAKGFCQGECGLGDGLEYGYQPADDAGYNAVRELCAMIQHKLC